MASGNIDSLNFEVLLDDDQFKKGLEEDLKLDKEFNISLSQVLDLRKKAAAAAKAEAKERAATGRALRQELQASRELAEQYVKQRSLPLLFLSSTCQNPQVPLRRTCPDKTTLRFQNPLVRVLYPETRHAKSSAKSVVEFFLRPPAQTVKLGGVVNQTSNRTVFLTCAGSVFNDPAGLPLGYCTEKRFLHLLKNIDVPEKEPEIIHGKQYFGVMRKRCAFTAGGSD